MKKNAGPGPARAERGRGVRSLVVGRAILGRAGLASLNGRGGLARGPSRRVFGRRRSGRAVHCKDWIRGCQARAVARNVSVWARPELPWGWHSPGQADRAVQRRAVPGARVARTL